MIHWMCTCCERSIFKINIDKIWRGCRRQDKQSGERQGHLSGLYSPTHAAGRVLTLHPLSDM